jgi:hypothetical protein
LTQGRALTSIASGFVQIQQLPDLDEWIAPAQ